MPDRVSTIRFKVEGTREVTSKMSELNREAVRQQRDLARSLAQATKEQAGGIDPTDTIRRARTEALRLANIRASMAKEQADLQQRELANSRSQYESLTRVRLDQERKVDEKTRATQLDQLKANIVARAKAEDEKTKVAKKGEDDRQKAIEKLDRQRSAAMIAEEKRRMREEAAAGAGSGALSGFGGKMVLGNAIGQVGGALGIGGLGAIASGFLFGNPAVGAATAGLELFSGVLQTIQRAQEETRAFEHELDAVIAKSQAMATSLLPITRFGAQQAQERAQIEVQQKAEQREREGTLQKFGGAAQFMTAGVLPPGVSDWIYGKISPTYAKQQAFDEQQKADRAKRVEEERRVGLEDARAARAAQISLAKAGTVTGERGALMRLQIDDLEQQRQLTAERAEKKRELLAEQENERRADPNYDKAKQNQEVSDFDKETKEQQAALRDVQFNERVAKSAQFVFGETQRLSPISQLHEYAAKLQEAVNIEAVTLDRAKDLMARKTGEVLGSLYRPGFAQVFDSRQRINIAALHPMQSPAIPAYASGTDDHPGGIAMVGEHGPEMVHLPRHARVIPKGGMINGVPTEEALGKSAHLRDPRQSMKVQDPRMFAMRMSRWMSGTGTGREMGNSPAFNEWAKTHPLHAALAGTPRGNVGTVQNDIFAHAGAAASGSHAGGWHHGAGYYQSHSMLARVRASHSQGKGKDLNHMVDPLTGRPLAVGSAMVGGAFGGGGASAISASMGQSSNMERYLQEILGILKGGH